jgi:hypothetical protein
MNSTCFLTIFGSKTKKHVANYLYCLTIKSKVMKTNILEQKDPNSGCCGGESGCCGMTDWGCC